jgi:malate dehydrogenase
MSVVAIVGAGPGGAAIAHRLAERARVRRILLIDDATDAASGKALDIRQSGPVGRFDVDLSASSDVLAGVGAAVVVVADAIAGGEWKGEPGLALVERVARAGGTAPFVFAGPSQTWLQEKACTELKIPADRLIGSAAAAQVGAARALVGLELGLAGTDVQITVAGRPPAFTIGWSSATVGGSLVTERLPSHRLLAIADALARLWPPGPQAIGAATARIIEALASGSRQLHQATTVLDGELGVKGVAAMLPLELGDGRVLRRVMPTLSPQEKTALLKLT